MLVATTQRVDVLPDRNERRNALDQRMVAWLLSGGLQAVPVPNLPQAAIPFVERTGCGALVLTGGNSLCEFGGNAPERDATERVLVEWALSRTLPILGICRGAQLLTSVFDGSLCPVSGHVRTTHVLRGNEQEGRTVASFHEFAIRSLPKGFAADAWCVDDGTPESIHHVSLPILAVMWHPEREPRPHPADRHLLELLNGRRTGALGIGSR